MKPYDPSPPSEVDVGQIIDFRAVRNWLGFILHAVLKRKKLVGLVAFGVLLLAFAVVSALPRTYRSTTRLLAQRGQALALKGADNGGPDSSPTRAANEIILRRENLMNLIKETDLVTEWKNHRGFLFRIKDRISAFVGTAPTEKQMVDALADYLATRISVWTDDNTISIQVDWRDATTALRLVEAAERNFLEARHVQEVSTFAEAASILEGHAADVSDEIDKAVANIQDLRERKKTEEKDKATKDARQAAATATPPPARASTSAAPARPAEESEESNEQALQKRRRASELPVLIETKERTITELENFRLRRLAELQAKLQELKGIYTEAHPAVADVEQALNAASHESPEVTRLRAEVKQLRTEYDGLRATTGAPRIGAFSGRGGGIGTPNAGAGLGEVIRIEQGAAEDRDPEIEYAKSKLRFAIEKYQSLQEQIHQARIDLDRAQAAFKYRYSVLNPAEIAKKPIAPKPPLIMIAALLGGLVIGMIAALALELHENIVSHSWQVEQVLSVKLLGSVQLSSHEK